MSRPGVLPGQRWFLFCQWSSRPRTRSFLVPGSLTMPAAALSASLPLPCHQAVRPRLFPGPLPCNGPSARDHLLFLCLAPGPSARDHLLFLCLAPGPSARDHLLVLCLAPGPSARDHLLFLCLAPGSSARDPFLVLCRASRLLVMFLVMCQSELCEVVFSQ
ncbi:hypothetical protein NQZ68_034443, partial [Dissostichus eleginoides]